MPEIHPNQYEERQEALRLLSTQRRLVIITLLLVIAYLAVVVAQMFSDILRILAISVFVCYTIIEIVDLLEKPLRSRANAVLAVYGVGGVIVLLGLILLIPALVQQVTALVKSLFEQLPTMGRWVGTAIHPLENKLHILNFEVKPSEILMRAASSLPQPDGTIIFSQVSGVAVGTMTWLFYGLSVLILTFYFLLDGPRMAYGIVHLFPQTRHEVLTKFVTEVHSSLRAFFRGQILLGFLFGAVMTIVYWCSGVYYALALGVILGLWEIVPVIGPILGFIPAALVVLLQETVPDYLGGRWTLLIILIVVFQLFQWIKDNVIAPRYIGDVIGLHPVLIFIAIMIGARVDGMLGIIVSLPVACVVNVSVRHLIRGRIQRVAELNAEDCSGTLDNSAMRGGGEPEGTIDEAPDDETQDL
ncbi:MAG: AI-2E family transporter [Cyanobacteria bacterium]|nr:AI-2E family transporter [Cyanobacteriota bacterium]